MSEVTIVNNIFDICVVVLSIIMTCTLFLLLQNVSYNFILHKAQKVKEFNENTGTSQISSGEQKWIERLLDIICSIMVILFLNWLVPIVAIIIKTDSKGPIFSRVRRTGLNGGSFWCYRFRACYINTDKEKKNVDGKVTDFGLFLRKTSIDVLPMFFNVLRGDMSVVGRNNVYLSEEDKKLLLTKDLHSLLSVKPGIVSIYNLSNDIKEISESEKYKYDLFYINTKSLLLNLKILIASILGISKSYKYTSRFK